MKTDLGLRRDQKRLALTKLASLSDDHPLREKYQAWIDQLDSHASGPAVALAPLDLPAGPCSPPVLPATPTNATSGASSKRKNHVSADGGPQVVPATVDLTTVNRLLSENQVLRGMLARFA
jgi:hypothetical protein